MFGALQLGLGLTPRTGSRGVRAYAALANLDSGFVFDPIDDFVLVRDASTPANNFCGSMAQAVDMGILVNASPPTKWLLNSSSVLTSGSNLRCQYSAAGVPLGFLPEPQRTNLQVLSCQFDHANWAKAIASVTPDVAIAPDGTQTADLWVPDGTSGNHLIHYGHTVTAATSYTASIFFKPAGLSGTLLWREDAEDIVGIGIDLATMEVTSGAEYGGVEPVGNGWYRAWWTGQVESTTIRPEIRWSSTGNGVSGIYLWGAQLEAGLFKTSFIRTEGSQVTRNADNLYVDLSKVPFDPAAYTVIAHAQPSPDNAASGIYRLVELDDGTTSNRAGLVNSTAGEANLRLFINSGGALSASLHAGVGTTSAAFKAAFAAAANDFEFVVGGVRRGTATSGAMPLSPTRMRIGCQASGAGQWSAPIGFTALIPELLTDMIARTS